MRILLQRVAQASVTIEDEIVGEIGKGILLFVGFKQGDTAAVLQKSVDKVLGLRIFSDNNGRFQYSSLDVRAGILAVSQFTLYGDTKKGRRPDFTQALHPDLANDLFDQFVTLLGAQAPADMATGQFGADMKVSLINDGPVTIALEF